MDNFYKGLDSVLAGQSLGELIGRSLAYGAMIGFALLFGCGLVVLGKLIGAGLR